MRKFDDYCGGSCYVCICQVCKGNCALHCLITNEHKVMMDDEEEYVEECEDFEHVLEEEES